MGAASPGLKDKITKTLGARGGNAVWGPDYVWLADSPASIPPCPRALMVWQDGQNIASESSRLRLFAVVENLEHQKLLPPMVHVLIDPVNRPPARPCAP